MSQEKHAPQGSMRSCVIFVEMSASLSSSLQSVVMEQLASHILAFDYFETIKIPTLFTDAE